LERIKHYIIIYMGLIGRVVEITQLQMHMGFSKAIPYLNEAVVEEEAEKGGAHPGVAVDGTRHDGAHRGLQRRAAGVVERRRELAIGRGREKQEKGKEQAMAGRGRSHHGHPSLHNYLAQDRALPC
jgi:hypothetical protein